jgi:hypothetical protein
MIHRFGCALAACLAAGSVMANDFPTQARVEYVLACMDRHGGQSYDTLYPCICAVDKIAARMTYEQYTHAETMSVMIRTPGERGGAFRDAPDARKEVRGLKGIQKDAEGSCFVGRASGGGAKK